MIPIITEHNCSGLSAVGDSGNPYRKNAKFSTPLDDVRTQVTSG